MSRGYIPEKSGCDVTLTLRRPDQDITCHMVLPVRPFKWALVEALDEEGGEVSLSQEEWASLVARASAGEDEAGDDPDEGQCEGCGGATDDLDETGLCEECADQLLDDDDYDDEDDD